MQRVGRPVDLVDRAAGRHQCLGKHLPAEDPPRADVVVLPAIDVQLERLEVEKRDE